VNIVNIPDDVYEMALREAARRNISVDELVRDIVILENNIEQRRKMTPAESLVGLFADDPDEVDRVMEYIMEARSEPWRIPND
jgi:hypothetical protein